MDTDDVGDAQTDELIAQMRLAELETFPDATKSIREASMTWFWRIVIITLMISVLALMVAATRTLSRGFVLLPESTQNYFEACFESSQDSSSGQSINCSEQASGEASNGFQGSMECFISFESFTECGLWQNSVDSFDSFGGSCQSNLSNGGSLLCDSNSSADIGLYNSCPPVWSDSDPLQMASCTESIQLDCFADACNIVFDSFAELPESFAEACGNSWGGVPAQLIQFPIDIVEGVFAAIGNLPELILDIVKGFLGKIPGLGAFIGALGI